MGESGEGLWREGGLSAGMIDKIVPSVESALADVRDGSTILVGGFGGAGVPEELVDALIAQGATDLVTGHPRHLHVEQDQLERLAERAP